MPPSDDRPPRRTRLFDLRTLIGGVLALYGLVLVIVGIVDGTDALRRADGIRINLWTGIVLLVVAGLFFLWSRLGGEASRAGGADDADGDPEE